MTTETTPTAIEVRHAGLRYQVLDYRRRLGTETLREPLRRGMEKRLGELEADLAALDATQAFLADKPTLLRERQGYRFYECPECGDESTTLAITPAGRLMDTHDHDIPDAECLAAEEGHWTAFAWPHANVGG
ncbi:MAG: hypothetical protein OXC11_08640 [Rhodospirillales bacterium]|nr:hypothetical protein [Rhodospirillales bacterium]